jgi:hypothetical protein
MHEPQPLQPVPQLHIFCAIRDVSRAASERPCGFRATIYAFDVRDNIPQITLNGPLA